MDQLPLSMYFCLFSGPWRYISCIKAQPHLFGFMFYFSFGAKKIIEVWTHCNALTRNSSLGSWFLASRLPWTPLPSSENLKGHTFLSYGAKQMLQFLWASPAHLSLPVTMQEQPSQVSVSPSSVTSAWFNFHFGVSQLTLQLISLTICFTWEAK